MNEKTNVELVPSDVIALLNLMYQSMYVATYQQHQQ